MWLQHLSRELLLQSNYLFDENCNYDLKQLSFFRHIQLLQFSLDKELLLPFGHKRFPCLPKAGFIYLVEDFKSDLSTILAIALFDAPGKTTFSSINDKLIAMNIVKEWERYH